MVQATVAVVEAMAGSWQRACDGEGEVPAIEGGGEGSGERRRADGVVMAGCEGGGGDVADVMMVREASTRVAVVTVVVEGAEPGVGGRRRPSRVGPHPKRSSAGARRKIEKFHHLHFRFLLVSYDRARRDLSIAPFGLEFH